MLGAGICQGQRSDYSGRGVFADGKIRGMRHHAAERGRSAAAGLQCQKAGADAEKQQIPPSLRGGGLLFSGGRGGGEGGGCPRGEPGGSEECSNRCPRGRGRGDIWRIRLRYW